MKTDTLVSVIVPTRNSAATLEACLRSISAQTYSSIELIVVDRDSTDGTKDLARAHGAIVLNARPERSAQRNAGARAAKGVHLLFVDSDMILEEDVVQDCVDAACSGGPATAVVVPERGFDDTLLARARSLEKRCYVGNDMVEAARFYPRDAFLATGGFDESMSAGEDWDLADRWRRSGGVARRATASIIHDDRGLTLPELLRKRVFYGRRFSSFLRKHKTSGLRHMSLNRFLSRPRLLLREPVTAVTLLVMKALEAVAFGVGIVLGSVGREEDPVFGRTRRASETLGATNGRRVLDVGSSGAWLAQSHPDREIVSTDIYAPTGVAAERFTTADARHLPFGDATFDVVCFFDVLEHVPRGTESHALAEIFRVLKPGGTLLLSTPHRHVAGCLLDPAWLLRGHRHYRLSSVRDLLTAAGFDAPSLTVCGGAREAFYVPAFYAFRRLGLRLPFERRWRSGIDREYARAGWYTIFATTKRPHLAEHVPEPEKVSSAAS